MNLCVLDVETTGTSAWSRVVEVGVVAYARTGHELGRYQSFVFPNILDERADRALKYNSIRREDVEHAPSTMTVQEQLAQFCDNYSIGETWAYNRSFDERMLLQSNLWLPWKLDGGCILRLARENMPPRAKDPPLADAALCFGVPSPEGAHRALRDALVAAGVLFAIGLPE